VVGGRLDSFLGYTMRCNMQRRTCKIFGNQGKQVRDAIHSHDVVSGRLRAVGLGAA
jgi:CDP-paratose 2-epimerase